MKEKLTQMFNTPPEKQNLPSWKNAISDLKQFLITYPRYILLTLFFTTLPFIIAGITFFVLTLSTPSQTIPQLSGLSILDAASILQKNNLTATIIPQNSKVYPRYFVIDQDIKAHQKAKVGREILLYVSTGPLSHAFPSYLGEDIYKVQALLHNINPNTQKVFISDISWVESNKPFGQIIRQSPLDGNYEKFPLAVSLVVSKGKSFSMPYLIQKYASSAVYTLTQKHIHTTIVYKKTKDPSLDGKIISQYPKQGTPLSLNNTVHLTVAKYSSDPTLHIVYTVPSELDGKKLRLILRDKKGKFILFEGNVSQGDILIEDPPIFGTYSIKLYIVENDLQTFYTEIHL